ncbi:glycosyltransferase [Vibrio diabolicus]|uniref:glycosyltransferase n=1 Tax=Vibrio diabolicus TaxID=50719 RepID=UPI003751BA56
MSKLLFLVNHQLSKESGISKKIINQFDALSAVFDTSFLCNFNVVEGKYFRSVDNKAISKSVNYSERFSRTILEYNFTSVLKFCNEKKITHIYIRYTHFAHFNFISFIRKLKMHGVKIVIEIPTFPYDDEYISNYSVKGIYSYLRLSSERLFRKYMRFYVDRVVTFSEHDEIFGIKAINISNAVSTELSPCSSIINRHSKNIKFVGVAVLAHWHGYDRFIKSLAAHYSTHNHKRYQITFDIVGGGPLLDELKLLAKELDVSEYVTFHGYLSGKELDRVISQGKIMNMPMFKGFVAN